MAGAYSRSGAASSNCESSQAIAPAMPTATKNQASFFLAKSENNRKPSANPTNPNATHGKIGNNQVCGSAYVCTPLMYDSIGQGRRRGRPLVHNQGVATAIRVAAAKLKAIAFVRDFSNTREAVAQVNSPISIIDSPKIFSTSTRNKSVHGALGYPKINSCPRNSRPNAKISAPRKIVVRAIALRATPFSRNRCVTIAEETPARKMNSGAGTVAAACDQR